METGHSSKLWVLCAPDLVFSRDNQVSLQSEFEGIFRSFGEDVQFQYFRSFGRVLVNYDNEEIAFLALNSLQGASFHGVCLRLEPVKPLSIGGCTLNLPNKTRNFLLSPPPSPPLGWEPAEEAPPVIDYNLVAAMARLRLPGDSQEVFSAGCTSVPSIVVSCIDEEECSPHHPTMSSLPSSFVQTSRPPL